MRNVTSVVFMCVFVTILSGQTPSFTPAGVVNAASFAGGPIAPRELVNILGTGLGPNDSTGSCDSVPEPTTCGGTSVLVNGKPAPILTAFAIFILFEAPVDLSGSIATLQVTTQVNGQTLQSAIATISVAAAVPGIFNTSVNGANVTTGIFIRTADGTLISTSNPALPGDRLTGYGTGFGKTNPIGTSGNLAPAGAQLTEPVTVTIGGLAASGVAPVPSSIGMAASGIPAVESVLGVGVDEVSFIVPLNVTAGNKSVVVTVDGQPSPSVLLPMVLKGRVAPAARSTQQLK
jgi:uncharacterized protein (TIGR03437 family)